MSFGAEYHRSMQRWVSGSGAVLVALFFSLPLSAQINGTPASVTSPGFGGHSINGVPPSVTSLGPRGAIPGSGRGVAAVHPGEARGHDHGHRGHNDNNGYGYGYAPYSYVYGVPVPDEYYGNDQYAQPDNNGNNGDYQGGPTIFDRRGSGAESYVPPMNDPPPAHAQQPAPSEQAQAPQEPETPPTPTVLVFKDGHQIEVDNYAIVGQTLYDMTPGHTRKVPISSLDIDATQKQNDDRGVTFQLPTGTQAG